MSVRLTLPIQSVYDNNGLPMDGAKLGFFETGTSTPVDTYSDPDFTTPNTNPVIADASGRFGDIFLKSGDYKVTLHDKDDNIIWTADPYTVGSTQDFRDLGDTGGTGSEYTADPSPGIISYERGQRFIFTAHIDNTGPATIDISDLGPISFKFLNGDGSLLELPPGALQQGQIYDLVINSTTSPEAVLLNTKTFIQSNEVETEISSGAINFLSSVMTVDTEASASTDDLETINLSTDSTFLVISSKDSSREVVLKTGVGNIVNPIGSDVALNNINDKVFLFFDGSNWIVLSSSITSSASGIEILEGLIKGLLPFNGSGDPLHDIGITTGSARDAVNSTYINLLAVITKSIDVDWIEGDNEGGFPSGLTLSADTWYHVFVISKSSGIVDAGFDSSLDASNLLADAAGDSYVNYRRIGSVLTDSSSNIIPGAWKDLGFANRFFLYSEPVLDVSVSTQSTTSVDYVISVPLGIFCRADMNIHIEGNTLEEGVYVRNPDISDIPPVIDAVSPLCTVYGRDSGGDGQDIALITVDTNDTSEIAVRSISALNQPNGLEIVTVSYSEKI